jgi:hypothetical protein
MRDGATFPVIVRGNPGVRVQVVVYLATMVDGKVAGLTPISHGGDALTRDSGIATTRVTIPALRESEPGGWALVSLAGVTDADIPDTIGGFIPFGTQAPTLLGDGYGKEKPAGAVLDLHLVGTIPGSQFAVDYADDAGIWREATIDGPDANVRAMRPDEVAIVRYQMPRGLTATPHKFRLRNLTAGTIPTTWEAIPATKAEPVERMGWGEPPATGQSADLDDAYRHPTELVSSTAGWVGIGALAVVLAGVPLVTRRHRLDD